MVVLRISAVFLALGLSTAHAEPVAAQGFFQSLFGSYNKLAPARRMPPQSSYGHGSYSPYWSYDYRPSPRPRSSRLRAVCVRTCDGFYWPMTNRAKRSQLYDLAKACSNSCDGGAQLYYMAANSTDTAGMVDMQGRPYAALETAFVYRKTYMRRCQCKPAPWAFSEQARHRSYARPAIADDIEQQIVETEISEGHRTILESLDDETGQNDSDDEVTSASLEAVTDYETSAVSDLASETKQQQDNQRHPTVRKAARAHRAPRVTRAKKPKPAWGLFGGGQAKYVWPGDRRRR